MSEDESYRGKDKAKVRLSRGRVYAGGADADADAAGSTAVRIWGEHRGRSR